MDEFRQWWGTMVKGVVSFLGHMWERLANGLMNDWDLRFFIFGAAAFMLIGLFSMLRKKF